jgi:hypothetical protein
MDAATGAHRSLGQSQNGQRRLAQKSRAWRHASRQHRAALRWPAWIIDWGNVCVAPPTLDLANISRIDSTEWDIYLGAYRAAGDQIDTQTCRRAYCWARTATALMYLPWIAEHKPDAWWMIMQIEKAVEGLERSS